MLSIQSAFLILPALATTGLSQAPRGTTAINATGQAWTLITINDTVPTNVTINTALYEELYSQEDADKLDIGGALYQTFWADLPDTCPNTADVNYRICGVTFGPSRLTANLTKIYNRTLNDPGDCSYAINKTCQSNLRSAISDWLRAHGAAQFANETCRALAKNITTLLPESCTSNSTAQTLLAGAVPADLAFVDQKNCTNDNDTVVDVAQYPDNAMFGGIAVFGGLAFHNTSEASYTETYDQLVSTVNPMFVVSFPVDGDYMVTNGNIAVADQMTCIRAKNITAGSRVPPRVPSYPNDGPSLRRRMSSFLRLTAISITFASWVTFS